MTDFQTAGRTLRARGKGWDWIRHGTGKWCAFNVQTEQAGFRPSFEALLAYMESPPAEPGSGDSIDSSRVILGNPRSL